MMPHILKLALVLAAIFLAGCRDNIRESLPADLSAVKVRAEALQARQQLAPEDVPGTVRPRVRAAVEAKVSGRISGIPVIEGQQVSQGQLLARLDVRELQARLDQAKAVKEEADREFKRYSLLVKERAAAQADLEAAQAKARVADATVREMETMLGYAEVSASFDGVITRKLVNTGDQAVPGRVLFEIEDPGTLRLEINLPEALVDSVKIGEQYQVSIAALREPLTAALEELAPAADPNSRTYPAKLSLPSHPGLHSGQFGRVAIPVISEISLQAPISALVRRGQLEMLYLIEDGRARMRLVRTGRRYGEMVELLAGAEAGELAVIADAASLQDGQPVEVLP